MPYYGYGYYYGFDPTWLLLLPALLLSLWAQWRVNASFRKYAQVPSVRGWSGAAVARKLLDDNGLRDVQVVPVAGSLTDHYDPKKKTLALSREVYGSSSLAALGVAAHETGHALQHAQGYKPLALRSTLVPVANLGSQLALPVFLAGLLFSFEMLTSLGIVLFSAAVLFQLVTLPVEFNASSRALELLETEGFLAREEVGGARAVLRAAALTYVAAALSSLLQLARLVLLSSNRRRR